MTDSLPAAVCLDINVVLVGPFADAEFAPLVERAASLTGPDQLRAYASVRSLIGSRRAATTEDRVDLLIVLQSWPEQYTQAEALDLLDQLPLARLVVCYGPWCDSDGRTRSVWPHAVRVPLAQAAFRLQLEAAALRASHSPLPLTANRDECFAHDYSRATDGSCRDHSVALKTDDPAIRDWLAGWICDQGWSRHDSGQTDDDPDVLIWDVDPWSAEIADQVAAFRRRSPKSTIIGLVGFARDHEVAQMHRSGVAAVLTKTTPSCELRRMIETHVNRSAGTAGLPQADRSEVASC